MTLALLVAAAGVSAQEITYNLEPTHELGPELWSIPIGGRLTMSADGTRMLVASIADSAFFVVDVETGEYRKTPARFYADNTFGFTSYTVDAGLHILVESTTTSLDTLRSWDLDSDTLFAEALQTDHYLAAVSGRHDRLIRGTTLLKATTLEPVTTLPGAYRAWFDDDKRKVYLSSRNVVYEADALTGEIGREWVIRATSSEVRRPKDSDWLYVFAIESNTLDGQNWVEAINLVTGEHLKFSKYFWSLTEGQPELLPFASEHAYSTANTGIVNGRDLGHSNVTWEFSAESRRSNTVLDLRFFYGTRETEKLRAIGPNKELLCHTWWTRRKDSSITRCNALVPVATSVGAESVEIGDRRATSDECFLSGEVARIYNVLGMQIATLPLSTDGTLSRSQLESLPWQPLWAVSGNCVRRVR